MIIFIQTMLMLITFGQFSLYNITYVDRTIDTPISELNNHTLREVFESLVTNPNLTDTSGWLPSNSVISVNNSIVTVLANAQYGGIQQNIDSVIGNTQYIKVRYYPKNTNHRIIHQQVSGGYTPTVVNQWVVYTFEATVINNNNGEIRILDTSTSGYEDFMVDYYYVVDKTAFGISSLTVEQMDNYFNEYQELKEVSEHSYTYTINEVTLTDFMVVLSSAVIWFYVIKFLKEVF